MSDAAETDATTVAKTRARLAGQSVLVTGGAGFIGSRLAHSVVDVCDLTVLDDLTTGGRDNVPDDATFVHGDVRDVETVDDAVGGVDTVFHLAALTEVDRSVRAPVETHGRNATGTMTVLEAARRYDARVVYASSAAVYGRPDSLPVHESDHKTPTSPYGISKLAGDASTRAYADLYGLPTVVLRYFNVYGERPAGGSDVVSAFLDRARSGRPFVVHGDGSQTRDFVHVDDVVTANLRAALTDATGRAYNVGTGEATSIRELAEHVRRATGTSSEIVERPPREGDIQHSRASVDRAREHLGFAPTLDLDDGLRSIVDATEPEVTQRGSGD